MDLKLSNKTAIVTGGTSGIGLAIAKTLYNEGVIVTITGREQEKLEIAASQIQEQGKNGQIITLLTDLSTKNGCDKLIAYQDNVNILINNLGIYASQDFFAISDEKWLHMYETNVLSGVRLSKHYLQKMLEQNWGRVVFIASESGIMIPSDMIDYGMTKTSQLSIANGLAKLTKGTQVTVNSILPGPTMTDGVVTFLKSVQSDPNASLQEAEQEFFAKHRQLSLLQRFIQPQEIANLTAFIASPLSAATTGAALRAEGGLLPTIY